LRLKTGFHLASSQAEAGFSVFAACLPAGAMRALELSAHGGY
jgi:hypothetical protein